MKLATALIAALTLTLCVAVGQSHAANIYWMNASGGNWNNASNWNTGTVPGPGDNVWINLPGTYIVNLDMNPTINSITLGYTSGSQILRCTSWELTSNGTVTIQAGGVLELNSSNLNTGGTYILNNYGRVDIEQSSIGHKVYNFGQLNVARTCSFGQIFYNDTVGSMVVEGNSSGSAVLTIDSGFTNSGAISLTSSYPVTTTTAQIVVNKGYLVNTATGVITGDLGASFNNTSIRTISAAVQNAGTINAVSAGLSIVLWQDTVTNTGSLIGDGALLGIGLSGGSVFTNTGTISTTYGGAIGFSNGEFVFDSGTLSNAGSLNFSAATVTLTPQLTNAGTISLSGSTAVTISDTLTNDGTISQVGGTVDGPAPIVNNGTLTYSTGTVNAPIVNNGSIRANISVAFNDTLITSATSQIVCEATSLNDCFFTLNKGLANNGTISLTQSAQHNSYLSILTEDTLVNEVGGTIESLHGDGATAGSRYIDAWVRNEGSINCVDANLYLYGALRWKINNGTITASGASVSVQGPFFNTGTVHVDAPYSFTHQHYHMWMNNGSFTGDGLVLVSEDTLTISGVVTNEAEMRILGGSNVCTGGLLNTGSLLLSGADFNADGAFVNQGSAEIAGSTLLPAFYNEGTLVTTGTCHLNGATTNDPGDTIWVTGSSVGSATLYVDSTFSNGGVIMLTSDTASSTTTATLDVSNGPLNNSGTIVADLGSGTGGTRNIYAELKNTGTVTVNNVALDVAKAEADHVNDGTINVTSGALSFTQSGGTPSLINNGDIIFSNLMTMTVTGGAFGNGYMGSLKGTGSLNVYGTTFTNGGSISPGLSPGKLNIQSNNFAVGSTGRLYFELGGTAPITEYDQLYCTQNMTLGGEMHISLIDGFIPAVHDTFQVVQYAGSSGSFLGSFGLHDNGVMMTAHIRPTDIILVVDSIVNTAPIWAAVPDTVTFDSMDSLFIGVWNYAYDPDQDDSTLDYSFSVSNDTLTYAFANGFLLLKSADPDFFGDVDLIMTVTDMHGASAVDTIVVAVTTMPNTAPVIAGLWDSLSFAADSTIYLGIWGYVTDAETDDSLLSYQFAVSNDSLALIYDASTGILRVGAELGFNGTSWMFLTVTDPKGLQASDSTKFVVTWNWPPEITGLPDSLTMYADSTALVNIWNYVSDIETADAALTYDFTVSNDSLTASYNGGIGLLTISSDLSLTGEVLLILTVTDEGGLSAADTTVVTVLAPLNHPPVITGFPDTLSFAADTTEMLNIWSYVSDYEDADNELTYAFAVTNDTLVASFNAGAGFLTLSAADSTFYGPVDLVMTVTDQAGDSTMDTVYVIVTQVLWPNLPPQWVGLPDTVTMHTDSIYTLHLWDFATDDSTPDSLLTITGFFTGGTGFSYLFYQQTGVMIFDPNPNATGTWYVHLIVKDEELAEDRDTITVIVYNDNTAPEITGLPDTLTFRTDSTATFDLYAAVSDAQTPDSILTFLLTKGNDSLQCSLDSTSGIVTLSAANEYAGATWLQIRVIDQGALDAWDTVQVVVNPIPNTPPQFVNLPDTLMFDQDAHRPFRPCDYLTDAESPFTALNFDYTRSNLALKYSFSLMTCDLDLWADSGWSGTAFLYITVTDPGGLSVTDTIEITVVPPMSADDDQEALPDRFGLGQNYPNPFNPTTMISFMLPEKGTVSLTVYNVLGQYVTTLASGEYGPGTYETEWIASNDQGRPVTSGVYFYRLEVVGKYVETRKMLLLR